MKDVHDRNIVKSVSIFKNRNLIIIGIFFPLIFTVIWWILRPSQPNSPFISAINTQANIPLFTTNVPVSTMPADTHTSDFTIPIISKENTEVHIDGTCDQKNEYKDATEVTFTDYNGEADYIFLEHDNRNLYICFNAKIGSDIGRMGTVFLDSMVAQTRRISVDVHIIAPIQSTWEGPNTDLSSGKWTWIQKLELNSLWKGASTTVQESYEAFEFSIPLTDWPNRGNLGYCNAPFRIGVYHQWVNAQGDGYGWPSAKPNYWNEPNQWQVARLADAPCP